MDHIQFSGEIRNHADLPHYPNPGLRETLARYLDWLEPLSTAQEWKQAQAEVQRFQSMEQFPLIEKRMDLLAQGSEDSYIFNYWVKGHLGFRDPVCPYTSVPILYENPTLGKMPPAQKAAAMLATTAEVYRSFRETGNGAYSIGRKVYSNDELWGALASINHIARDLDTMYICDHLSRHSLLLHRNRLYLVEVLDPQGAPVPYGDILNAVRQILEQEPGGLETNLNLVTAEPDRDRAGDLLEALLRRSQNSEAYQLVKDAIAVINLDDCSPEPMLQRLYCACFDPLWFNRFHGKGTQFNIAANGKMSMIVDHTYCDGGIEVYLVNRVGEVLRTLDLAPGAGIAAHRELQFDLSGFDGQLRQCMARCRSRMAAFDARVADFPGLNRAALEEKGILSGDGFIHLAFQAAQQLTWGEIRNTYISVDCRRFFRGRTEVNRPVTHASKAFVQALLDESTSPARRRQLMMEALDAHHQRTKQAQNGLGVTRYLFTLREVCKDCAQELGLKELPAFFQSAGYARICEDRLSCTSFGNDQMQGCYFPPVMPHGLGIFYHVDETAYAVITAFLEDDGLLNTFVKHLHHAVALMLSC